MHWSPRRGSPVTEMSIDVLGGMIQKIAPITLYIQTPHQNNRTGVYLVVSLE